MVRHSKVTPPYLNVELKGPDSLLQHAIPLLLCQLHAVHSTAIELFEQVGAGHAGESKEGQTIAIFQTHGLLGDPTKNLSSRQVTQVSSVSVSKQELWVFFADLKMVKKTVMKSANWPSRDEKINVFV